MVAWNVTLTDVFTVINARLAGCLLRHQHVNTLGKVNLTVQKDDFLLKMVSVIKTKKSQTFRLIDYFSGLYL